MSQQPLFQSNKTTDLTIEEAARALSVSTASIRNWLRLGYLKASGTRRIQRDSFEKFASEIAGSEKLTHRANKLHRKTLPLRLQPSPSNSKKDADQLAQDYESGLPDALRNKEGIYYTPPSVAARFFNSLPQDCSQLTFCDPCCGTGNFLIAAIEHGFSPHKVFGFDTDPKAVEIAQKRIFEKFGHAATTIRVADFFSLDTIDEFRDAFDVIFTNPPWGKKLPKEHRNSIAQRFHAGKSNDTSSLFWFGSSRLVRPNGYLGMLLPESFTNVTTFEDARKNVLQDCVTSIENFGKPFPTLLTTAVGITTKKTPVPKDHLITCRSNDQEHMRTQASFKQNFKTILDFEIHQEHHDIIQKILSKPHITLKENAIWGLGIVTGNNQKFVRNSHHPGYIPVCKGTDIQPGHIKPASTFIPEDLTLYQQVASKDLYEAEQKLVYRFISNRLIFCCDQEQRFLLNSANLLIPKPSFPVRQQVLADYLSGRLMNWLFTSIFKTHKVLRGDLEYLPIFHDVLASQKSYNEQDLLQYLQLEETSDGSFRPQR